MNKAGHRATDGNAAAAKPASAPAPRQEIIVASYNIHKCVGVDGKFDPARIADVIEEMKPDIIALQEVDTRFGERRGLLDLEKLERRTGLLPIPLSRPQPAHGWHGNIILYRQGNIRDVHEVKLPGLEPRGALVAEFEFGAEAQLRVIAAHLGLLRRSRYQQADRITELLNSKSKMPTLLLGDLNEWRLGGRTSLHSFRPAFRTFPDAVPSYPSRLPVLALDRIIANRAGLLAPVAAHDTPLSRVASDHLPLKTIVRI